MRLPFHRSLAITLALCAMVLRALLPDGWMPSAAAGAGPFVICSVDGVHTGGKAPTAPSREQSHAPCAFAAAAPLSPPMLIGLILSPHVQAFRIARAEDRSSAPATPAHRPNAPRAPPAFS